MPVTREGMSVTREGMSPGLPAAKRVQRAAWCCVGWMEERRRGDWEGEQPGSPPAGARLAQQTVDVSLRVKIGRNKY